MKILLNQGRIADILLVGLTGAGGSVGAQTKFNILIHIILIESMTNYMVFDY